MTPVVRAKPLEQVQQRQVLDSRSRSRAIVYRIALFRRRADRFLIERIVRLDRIKCIDHRASVDGVERTTASTAATPRRPRRNVAATALTLVDTASLDGLDWLRQCRRKISAAQTFRAMRWLRRAACCGLLCCAVLRTECAPHTMACTATYPRNSIWSVAAHAADAVPVDVQRMYESRVLDNKTCDIPPAAIIVCGSFPSTPRSSSCTCQPCSHVTKTFA